MAVGTRLNNGNIVLLLTPREATIIQDELLEPERFPWQNTESEMTSVEVKAILKGLVAEDTQDRLRESAHAMEHMLRQQQENKAEPEEPPA